MQPTKILLALFIILTIAFATLSAFEYVQLSSAKTSTQTTTQTSSIPGALSVLRIGGTLYTYSEWNSSTPNTFTVLDVKFVITANITVNYGGACYSLGSGGAYVAMTFPDGSTESMTTCTVGPSPLLYIQLSNHVNPQAGLLMVPSNGTVYFLVSTTPSSSTVTSSSSESQTGQVTFYRTNGDWNFSVTASSLVVPQGQPIDVYVNITNISGQTQMVHEVNPIINPQVLTENGTQVWAWNPPGINFFTNVTTGPGISSGPYVIPTSNLSVGQNYILIISPLIGTYSNNADYQIGESLTVTITISIT